MTRVNAPISRGPELGDAIRKWPRSRSFAVNISDIPAGGNGLSKDQPGHRAASPGTCWWVSWLESPCKGSHARKRGLLEAKPSVLCKIFQISH